MPAKLVQRIADKQQLPVAQSSLKKITREDFSLFVTQMYINNYPDGDCNRINKMQDSLAFLKPFETNPSDMKTILESRGTKNEPIVTDAGLFHAFQTTRTISREAAAERLLKWQEKAKQDLEKTLVGKNPTKREKLSKEYEAKLKGEAHNKEHSIKFAEYLGLMNYYQQISTKLDLSIASKEIICTPDAIRPFSYTCLSDQKESTEEAQAFIIKSIDKAIRLVFPLEKHFKDAYDKISKQMMTNQGLPEKYALKDKLFPCTYPMRVMDKESFISTVSLLQIWGAEQLSLEGTIALSLRLFKGYTSSIYAQIPERTIDAQSDFPIADLSNASAIEKMINISKQYNAVIDQSRAASSIHLTKTHVVHDSFAKFTAKVLSYLSLMQDSETLLSNAKPAYEWCLKQEDCPAKYEGTSISQDVVASYKESTVLQNTIYLENTKKLATLWTTILIQAQQAGYTTNETPEQLFSTLTHAVETDLGLHELTLNIFEYQIDGLRDLLFVQEVD
jgi:hypothetical protein